MKKRVADIVVETLIEYGITDAFSVVGGGAMHLNNAFALKKSELKTVYNHHEQASAMAAESYARLTGRLAAVCVTSGPGGLNTLNGVQSAWVDSIPMIVIAGHPRYDTTVEYSGLNVRSIGVQENDIISQVKNITKYAKMITDSLSVKKEIKYAIDIAMNGRRGPVWLSIPLDVQGTIVEEQELYPVIQFKSELTEPTSEEINELIDALNNTERPCILTGSGITSGAAREEYRKFLEFIDIPIVGGWGAPDINFNGEKNYYGISGIQGPRCGNFILQNADFILVLGNSLSSTQTGFNVEAFAPDAVIYMVDAQSDESKKIGLKVSKCINTDIKLFFKAFIKAGKTISASEKWVSFCNYLYKNLPHYEVIDLLPESDGTEKVHPTCFWKYFLENAEKNSIFTLGNSSCIAAILTEGISSANQRVIVNYHSGSMGIDLPFAIGASAGYSDSSIYCVTGDGCFMMNMQELQTIRYNKYKIKIVIFNNNGYDNIRNTCRNYFGGLLNGCDPDSGISIPDLGKVAGAFEFPYRKISCTKELKNGIDWLISMTESCILEICEKTDKERAPVIRSIMNEDGKFITPPLHIMTPLLSDEEIKKYIIN